MRSRTLAKVAFKRGEQARQHEVALQVVGGDREREVGRARVEGAAARRIP